MNYFVCNGEECKRDYIESLDSIYTDNEVIKYLTEYHKDNMTFFIGLCEDDMIDIDKILTTNDCIMLEDFRMISGSQYYMIKRKLFKTGISLRDILEQLKKNVDCRELMYDIDNENIVLVDIMKSNKSIQYSLIFDCYL